MLTFQEIDATIPNLRLSKSTYPGKDKVWEYLEKRGITRELAELCHLDIIQETDLNAALYRDENPKISTRICIVFPHHDPLGEIIPWWSARLIDTIPELKVVGYSFLDQIGVKAKKKKMTCPSGEPPHAYLAPGKDWGTIPRGERIYIHESCIKAINGSDLGKYSVGLNGVWGWKAGKYGINLVEELRLDCIPWKFKDLKPVIVFDSGIRRNDNVAWAATSLASMLKDVTGQDATILKVPDSPNGGEWGFDDFRMNAGDTEALRFLESEGEKVDHSLKELMFQELNQKVCVIRDLGVIVEQDTGVIMSKAKFTEVNYADKIVWTEGEVPKPVSMAKFWLTSPRRTVALNMDYMPGQERLVNVGDGRIFNLWRPSGCEPLMGSVDPWMEILANNVEDEYLRNWIISWWSFQVQNPGVKMNTSLLIFGPSGTGKGLFVAPFRKVFGDNAVTVSNDQLRSTFNSIYANRQLIHADELKRVRDEGDLVNQRIKLLVTDDKMIVNGKGVPEYRVRNCANLVLTSNYYDCVKLDQDDRRMCVVHWTPTSSDVDRRGDQPYWVRYVKWLEGDGPGALYQFLLEWDCSKFDPFAWAPGTKSKEDVTEASMAPIEIWVKDLWNDPDGMLPLISEGRCLWTANELAVLYYGLGKNELTPGQVKGMQNALRNQGFEQANGGNPLKPNGRDGIQSRFWVIKDRGENDWYVKPTSREKGALNRCLEHLKLFFK